MRAHPDEAAESIDQAAADIAKILTNFSQRIRTIRKADNYSLAQQDKSNFLREVFNTPQQSLEVTMTIAHRAMEETIGAHEINDAYKKEGIRSTSTPSMLPSAASVTAAATIEAVTTSSISSIREKPVLAFGFSSWPRRTLINNLSSLGFCKIQKMQDYMDGLQLTSNLTFQDYCDFLHQAEDGSLANRIKIQSDVACQRADLNRWVSFLEREVREGTFNFSHKLDTPEKRRDFFIKNCDLQRLYTPRNNGGSIKSTRLKDMIRERNLDALVNLANPGLDLLANEDGLLLDALQGAYLGLPLEHQAVLDAILTKAFFRKTSKLGLTFAKEQGIPVLFAWTAPKREGDETSLEELHQLLEIKPYHAGVFRKNESKISRRGDLIQDVPEAVTFSEMRELYRLLHRGQAPDHVLVRGIHIPEVRGTNQGDAITSSSQDKGQSSFGISKGKKKRKREAEQASSNTLSSSAAQGSARSVVQAQQVEEGSSEPNRKKRK